MNLSELIRAGAQQIEVANYWHFIDLTDDGKTIGCALGAAYLGAGGRMPKNPLDSIPMCEIVDTIDNKVGNKLHRMFVAHNHTTSGQETTETLFEAAQTIFYKTDEDFEATAKILEELGV